MTPDLAREIRRSLVDVGALVRALGLEQGAKRQPRGAIVRCAWHDDRDASCSIRLADDGTIAVRCFSCGQSGDALDLVAVRYGLSTRTDFREVLKLAAELSGRWDLIDELDGKAERRAPAPVAPPPPATPKIDPARYHEIATALLELCPLAPNGNATPASADVVTYLEHRGVFADAQAAGVCALPPAREQGAIVGSLRDRFGDDLELAGLFDRDRDSIPFAWNRLVIPWRRPDGSIASLQRRRLDAEVRGRYIFPRGVMTSHPFGSDVVAGVDGELVVTESALDCLARRRLARAEGERCLVVGLPSAKPSRAMLEQLADLARGRDVVLCLDADAAGDEGAAAIAKTLSGIARSLTRERPEGVKDAGELVQEASA